MANFQSPQPGKTRSVVQQTLPGHSAGKGKTHHGRAPTAAHATPGSKKAAPAAPLDDTPADLAAIAIYVWHGTFDRVKLRDGFIQQFGSSPHFDTSAIPHLELMIGYIESDTRVLDIRWMAYMLATAYWETTSLTKETVPTLDKHHKPMFDKKGKPLVHSRHRWVVTMSPVEEVGHGANRKYFLPVKVKSLPADEARVTEQDGDQFTVTAKGTSVAITKGAKLGTAATQKATKSYVDDDGTELAYYGRGYVQLTWWSNYAKASVELGMGLQLLLQPDLVLQPETAYKVMAHGMLTGKGFANGHKLVNYFHGSTADYVKARRMVNGSDHAVDIADVAKQFQTILVAAKS
jgi:hypothetical protein